MSGAGLPEHELSNAGRGTSPNNWNGGGGGVVYTDISDIIEAERTALLTKLREEIENARSFDVNGQGVYLSEPAAGQFIFRAEVLALLEKAGGEG